MKFLVIFSLLLVLYFSAVAPAFVLSTRQIGLSTRHTPPAGRQEAAVVFDQGTNTTYVFGGRSGSTVYSDMIYSVFSFPFPSFWTRVTYNNNSMNVTGAPSGRYGMVYGLRHDGLNTWLIIVGGATDYPLSSDSIKSEMWGFNFGTKLWQLLDNTTAPGVYGARGGIYHPTDPNLWVFYGKTNTGFSNSTWRYDFSQRTWSLVQPTNPGPSGRYNHGVALVRSNRFVLFGGCVDMADPCTANGETWIYTQSSNDWSQLTGTGGPSARYGLLFSKFGYNSSNLAVLYGGSTGSREVWYFNLAQGLWTKLDFDRGQIEVVPPGRILSAHTWRPSREGSTESSYVLMFGGYLDSSSAATNETFLFLGNTGEDVAPTPSIPQPPTNPDSPNSPDSAFSLVPLFLFNILLSCLCFLI